MISIFWLFTFFLEFAFFFPFSSPKKLPSEEKSKPKKHVGGRSRVGVNPSI
jgi:hypothetical protein